MDAPYQPMDNSRHADILVVTLLTALALALRLIGLGHESIWYDEAFTLGMAQTSYLDLLTGRVADPGNPFGYFFLLRGWLDLFGSRTIETARAFSALCGAFSVPAVWLLARTLSLTRRVAAPRPGALLQHRLANAHLEAASPRSRGGRGIRRPDNGLRAP